MTSHVLLLALFAFFVAVVFAAIAHDEPRAQAALGARIFGGFLLAGLTLGWLLYPLPL
ncbi:MAG TPA: hypothetical protein VMW48_08720 [Vicinamibacterales bacterium]|nr:hypothetical protein [Vicinamibacterales bacterium]